MEHRCHQQIVRGTTTSLSDLLHVWNAEEITLSYAGPELAMPISQTDIY